MSKPEIASEPASLLEQVSSSVGFITLLMKLYNNRTLACRNVALNTGVPWIFMVISFEEFVENHDLEDVNVGNDPINRKGCKTLHFNKCLID